MVNMVKSCGYLIITPKCSSSTKMKAQNCTGCQCPCAQSELQRWSGRTRVVRALTLTPLNSDCTRTSLMLLWLNDHQKLRSKT